jgi:hypothetical protein
MEAETTTVALIMLAVALVKIVDKLVDWVGKKMNGRNGHHKTVVQLDAEMSRIIHETHLRTSATSDIVSVKDQSGAPMVYTPRSLVEDSRKTVEHMRDLSYVIQRLVDRVEGVEDKVDDIRKVKLKGG